MLNCAYRSWSIRDGLADGSDELGVLDKSLDSLTETHVAVVLLLVVAILPHQAVMHMKSR